MILPDSIAKVGHLASLCNERRISEVVNDIKFDTCNSKYSPRLDHTRLSFLTTDHAQESYNISHKFMHYQVIPK